MFIRAMHNNAVLRARDVIRALGLRKGKTALDLGGGPGTYGIELAKKGIDVTHFDLPDTLRSHRIAFGTDVFGASRVFAMESLEFGARLKWFTAVEILRQATSINGELLALSGPRNPYGKLGVIEAGALADMLIVDGNPLQDIRVLEDPARNLRAIMKDGRFVKLDLPAP